MALTEAARCLSQPFSSESVWKLRGCRLHAVAVLRPGSRLICMNPVPRFTIAGKGQDLSKIEAGKMELCVERFEVRLMIGAVVGIVQPPVKKNGNQLEVKRVVPLSSCEDWTFFKKCSGKEAAASSCEP